MALLSAGCTRRVVSTRWLGIFRPAAARQTARAQRPVARPAALKPASPDASLRELFETQARGAFNPATDDRRIRLLNTRLRLDPQDAAARLELAAIYERYLLHEEALDQYTRALNLAPSEDSAAGMARAARASGNGAEVIPVLSAFLKRFPEAAEAWNELGMLYDDAGDRAAAERAFRQALAQAPASDRLHNNLGYNLLLQNLPDSAEAQFQYALHLNPNSAAARNNLGITLARRGDIDGARREFLAASNAATAHNNLAAVLIELGDYERARQELVKALQARIYFTPAIENLKLVQQLMRERQESATAAGRLPLSAVRLPAGLAPQKLVPQSKAGSKSEQPENNP